MTTQQRLDDDSGRGMGKEEEGKKEEAEEEDSPIPLDRGWAWMVVVGCFGMHVLVVGGVKSFGVLFVELQQLYDVTAQQLGLMHGLASVLMMALGPVSNALSVRYSCRVVVFAGGILIGSGFVLSAFVRYFNLLYLTYSFLTGVGSALAYAPSVVMVGHHFTERRALANGLSVSGSAVGSFLLPNLMRYLLNQYGLRGALATLGAVMLHVCACAVLFRPISSYRRPRRPAGVRECKSNSCEIQGGGAADPSHERCKSPSSGGEGAGEVAAEAGEVNVDVKDDVDVDVKGDVEVKEGVNVDVKGDVNSDVQGDVGVDGRGKANVFEFDAATDGVTSVRTPSSRPHALTVDTKTGGKRSSSSDKIREGQDDSCQDGVEDLSCRSDVSVGDPLDISSTEATGSDTQSPDQGPKQDIDRTPSPRIQEVPRSPLLDNRLDIRPRSPLQGRSEDPRSPNLPRKGDSIHAGKLDSPRSPSLRRIEDNSLGPNVGRRSPNLNRTDSRPFSAVLNNGQGYPDPLLSLLSKDTEEVTPTSIRKSLEKKLARNASVNSMITHFGSVKHAPRDPERSGSFKLTLRRDSSKSKSSTGSLKRKAFKGGRPILERHPSALWDTRLPDSLKQALEAEAKRPQRGDSIELSLLHRSESGDKTTSPRPAADRDTSSSSSSSRRFGSFKAIDVAKPIRLIQARKKLLLASNLRYTSETRDVGVATPTLVADEKAPLKRFYSVEAGHQPSPVLHEWFLHRRIRQISENESWRSESSVFASAGDLALASLQNIAVSVTEVEEDVVSTASTASRLKGLLRLSARSVKQGTKKETSVPLFDMSLMLNPVFLVFFLSLVCMNFGYPNIFVMLPSYCQEVGLDKTTAAFLVSVIGLTDLVGRLFIGWFSDLRLFPRKYGFMVSLAGAGVLCAVLPHMKSFHGLVTFACCFGFCGGCFIALIAVILVDSLGKERLATSFGLASAAMAVGLMAGPAIYGDIRDTAGSWDAAFVVAGLMSLAAASCIFMEPLAQHVLDRPIKMTEQQASEEML